MSHTSQSFCNIRLFVQNILKSKNIKIRIKNSVINKILSYGSEAWSLTKKERSQLNIFERKIRKKKFGPVFDNKINEWRILSNEELDQKSKEPNIVETVKISRLRWLGRVTWMTDNRLPKKLFVWEGPHTKHQEDGQEIDGRMRCTKMQKGWIRTGKEPSTIGTAGGGC